MAERDISRYLPFAFRWATINCKSAAQKAGLTVVYGTWRHADYWDQADRNPTYAMLRAVLGGVTRRSTDHMIKQKHDHTISIKVVAAEQDTVTVYRFLKRSSSLFAFPVPSQDSSALSSSTVGRSDMFQAVRNGS